MDPNINSNGIYSFLKRPKLLQHREIRLFYIEFLNVVNPHFPDATPKMILKQKGRLKNVIFVDNPLFTNARGLLVYTCSPKYREHKQKELGFTNLTIS